MQQGSARPLAVTYITVQGLPHRDQGLLLAALSEAQARLARGARGRERNAELTRKVFCGAKMVRLLARHLLEQGLVGPRESDRVLVEEDKSLQIDLPDADLRGDAHESRAVRRPSP